MLFEIQSLNIIKRASTFLLHRDIRGVDSVLLPVGIILKVFSI